MPSSEQKQSGSLQIVVSHGGARLGSDSISEERKKNLISMFYWPTFKKNFLPQAFSSEPSLQSFSPLQKRPLSIQFPSPQAKKFSWQMGSSVRSNGLTFLSLVFMSQFLTEAFQLQVCFSMSNARPAGHLMACRPCKRHSS